MSYNVFVGACKSYRTPGELDSDGYKTAIKNTLYSQYSRTRENILDLSLSMVLYSLIWALRFAKMANNYIFLSNSCFISAACAKTCCNKDLRS